MTVAVVGDAADYLARLGLTLPPWFGDAPPDIQAALAGWAAEHVNLFDTISYAGQQARLARITDGWVDAAAWDFFGTRVLRKAGEADSDFRLRVRRDILRPRATRAALTARLQDLTGNTPFIFEPARATDTGGLNTNSIGLGVAGRLGSMQMPNQLLVQIARPVGQGIPLIAGLGSSTGGLGVGNLALGSLADEAPHVTDADIYAAIVDVLPVGTTAWVALSGAPVGGVGYWDETFKWDQEQNVWA